MTNLVIGYTLFAVFALVMFVAWLFDFLDTHEIHLRPYWEEQLKQNGDEE